MKKVVETMDREVVEVRELQNYIQCSCYGFVDEGKAWVLTYDVDWFFLDISSPPTSTSKRYRGLSYVDTLRKAICHHDVYQFRTFLTMNEWFYGKLG